MTRLIFVNKVGKNENNYIIGSNVGSQSRFARSALKKRASNNASGKCCEFKDKPGLISLVISYVVTNINLTNLSDAQKNELINNIKTDYANKLNISSDLIDIQLIQGSLIIHVIIKSEISIIQNIKNKINTEPSINIDVKTIIKGYLDNIISGDVSIDEPIISDKVIPSITEICITPISIVNALNGKYLFNNSSTYNPFFRYSLNNGYYEFTNIPQIHAMAILNNNKTNLITYTGDSSKKLTRVVTGTTADGNYDFYYGTIKVYVYGNFNTLSVYCYNHGYMGGKNLLTYKNSCSSVNINNPPIFTSTQVTSAIQGTPYTYTVTINDENKDQTNDSITLSAPVKPSWLTFESGVLSGTPTLNSHLGDNNVTLRANDGTVDVDQTFVINVANTTTPQSYTINVSNSGHAYILSGNDKVGPVSGNIVNLNVDDTVNFVVNVESIHPFYIKKSSDDTIVLLISGTQGTTEGTLTWLATPAGDYYYVCGAHGNSMRGDIIVT